MNKVYMAVREIFGLFDLLEMELKGTNMNRGGGIDKTTEPYKTFEDKMNEIYSYVKSVYEDSTVKKKEIINGIKNMESKSEMSKYKAEERNMKDTKESLSEIYKLESEPRKETEIIIKQHGII
jgi:hypothetical protein